MVFPNLTTSMIARRRAGSRLLAVLGLSALVFSLNGCEGGQAGDPNNRGPFELVLGTTGSQQFLPYKIPELDSFQQPSVKIINISTIADLKANSNAINGVLPVGQFSKLKELPNGDPGNQFLHLKFSHDLLIESVLSGSAVDQNQNSGLKNTIQIISYDPATEEVETVKGIAFIGGFTFLDDLSTPSFDPKLVQAVSLDGSGNTVIVDARATGFPAGFSGSADLLSMKSFVFIPDTVANATLANFDTFPVGKIIRIIVTSSVLDFRGKVLVRAACVATSVTPDNPNTLRPEVLGAINSTKPLQISPGNGAQDVNPATSILVSFSKPVQPKDVGEFFSTTDKTPAFRGMTLTATITSNTFEIIYYADPLSASDLCNFTVKPAFTLPSERVHTLTVNTSINGLAGTKLGNQASTTFRTGDGPGLVNAPVAPEAIYVGRNGSEPGISVIDLNGFGVGTGDVVKALDPGYRFGFKRNPNLTSNANIFPNLELSKANTTNMDAGSLGFLKLTVDTKLSTLLLDSTALANVTEIILGFPLDMIFNNENINLRVSRINQQNPQTGAIQPGNSIAAPPIPNPPRLTFDPLFVNPAFNIFAEPPSRSNVVPVPPCSGNPGNLLVKGNPFDTRGSSIGVFHTQFPGIFYGPQRAPNSPPTVPPCPYSTRQQIGHFLYILDRQNNQILVVNSNRFQVIETIRLADPTAMAISPNLRRLAVTNFNGGSIVFIDTDPFSTRFHEVVAETKVGKGPDAMAWQPEGEDLLVLNRLSNSLSIIGGADLRLRKTIISRINNPIDIVVTPRQQAFGFITGIYFAYILNADGSIAIFESGPDEAANGIGFDDIVGLPEGLKFRNARSMQPDYRSFNSAIWLSHQDGFGIGTVSHIELTSSVVGPLPIVQIQGGIILPPTFRQRLWTVTGTIGGSEVRADQRLSGNNPVSIVLDEMRNNAGLFPLTSNQISNLQYADHSDKGMIRPVPNGFVVTTIPFFVFIALADKGMVDVVEIDTGRVIRRIPAPGVSVLSSYFKQ